MDPAARHFAINTYAYTMRYSAHETLSRLADSGVTTFELMMYPGHLWPAEVGSRARSELRHLIEHRELRITTLNMPNVDLNIAGATAEMRRHSLGIISAIIELAGEIGVAGVILGPGKPNPLHPARHEELESHFYAALELLLPIAKRAGTALLVENMPFAFLPDIKRLLATVERFGDDSLGIVYDLANGHFIGEDITAGLIAAAPRLRLVHVSDTGRDRYRHDPVGMGSVRFDLVPPVLKDIGYKELPMLEIVSSDPDSDIPRSTAGLTRLGWVPNSPEMGTP